MALKCMWRTNADSLSQLRSSMEVDLNTGFGGAYQEIHICKSSIKPRESKLAKIPHVTCCTKNFCSFNFKANTEISFSYMSTKMQM